MGVKLIGAAHAFYIFSQPSGFSSPVAIAAGFPKSDGLEVRAILAGVAKALDNG